MPQRQDRHLLQEAAVIIRFLSVVTFLLLFPFIANASVAGSVDYLTGDAWVERGGARISLAVGDSVDAGDVVVTTQSGRVKLIMKDESKVYVGSQSRITIDNYEMRGGSLFSGSFNMLWGKVRFLVTKLKTGSASFSVHTKTATIGVRGTQFAVMLNKPVQPQQLVPTTVLLFEGAVIGKSIKGQVANIKPGTIVRLKPDGAILTRKIEKHDLRVLDIEPLALRKGLRPLKKGTALSSPTRLGTKTLSTTTLNSPTRLDSTTTLVSPTKLDSTTTLTSPTRLDSSTTLISPTTLESATLLKDPTLSTTTTTLVKDPTLSTTTTTLDPTLSTRTLSTTTTLDPALSTTTLTAPTTTLDPTLSTTTLQPKIDPTLSTTTTLQPRLDPTLSTTTTLQPKIDPTLSTTLQPRLDPTLSTTTNTLSTTTNKLSTTTTTITPTTRTILP